VAERDVHRCASAFAVAASCDFPVLLMSMFWKGLTTRGALIVSMLGLISAVDLVILGPTVWEKVLLHPAGSAPFPYENPALFSMIIAFVGIWLFSAVDRSQTARNETEAYESQYCGKAWTRFAVASPR
jgi:cation/acetate symporter